MSEELLERRKEHTRGKNLAEKIQQEEGRDGGQLNPPLVEWLMGSPIGWSDLKPLEMDRFQQWYEQFGA